MTVSIEELRKDLLNRFKQAKGSEFGITNIDFPLKTENLIICLEHYSAPDITYKISFPKILSYVVFQDYLQESNMKDVTYSKDFFSPIISQIHGTKYMEYLLKWTNLNVFFESEALEKIKQYHIYTQNVMIDVISDQVPIIEILNTIDDFNPPTP